MPVSAYLTLEELERSFSQKVLIQLSNDTANAEQINYEVVEDIIALSSQRIDAALRSRYALPLAFVPTLIKQHCLYLVRYALYVRRSESKVPETVKETYNQAIKELEQIALGRLHLGVAEAQGEKAAEGEMAQDESKFVVRARERLGTEGY